MKTVNSVSGGKTSAYLAANYPADINIFALVRIEDKRCSPKDPIIKREAERRTGKEFIATAEEDATLYAVMDLEQFLGKEIVWVSGETFDFMVDNRGGWLPNKLHRYCTVEMKIRPIFRWIYQNLPRPVEQRIGFRANEGKRALKMLNRCNEKGIIVFRDAFEKWEKGRYKGKNKWGNYDYYIPKFPLIEDGVFKDKIEQFWKDKPVRFPNLNNCTGCFHRNPILLKKMSEVEPDKLNWFADQEEKPKKGTWKKGISYRKIIAHKLQLELSFSEFSDCDSGFCGL